MKNEDGDKRFRALIKLMLWFVFISFILVIIYVSK